MNKPYLSLSFNFFRKNTWFLLNYDESLPKTKQFNKYCQFCNSIIDFCFLDLSP